ncbi:hypothetical protein ACWEP5_13640 [Nocardia niigatensis]
MGTFPDAKPGLCDVLIKVEACGITHNELDWPIYDEATAWPGPAQPSAA